MAGYETLQCNYQLVNGALYFTLAGRDFNNHRFIYFNLDTVLIKADSIYQLDDYNTKQNSGRYNSDVMYYIKGPAYRGEFNVKYFDSLKQIISGTFWFDAVDTATNKVIQVRDGRFDVHYTR
ncbi:MAG: hypothetical protein ABI378_03285 [Chitinophagaceae bacterium]